MIEFAFHPGPGAAGIGLAALRISLGAFFAISGYHKLFNRERHASLRETLKADGIPFVGFNEWFVPSWEFVAGIALAVGFATLPAALILAVICLVACRVDGLGRIREWKPIDRADWLDDLLYLPEFLYLLMLVAVVLGGPGALALDSILYPLARGI